MRCPVRPGIVGRRAVWEGRFLRALELQYRTAAGDLIEWEAFERVNCRGIVAVVPFTVDGNVVLVKQFRPPIEKFVIEFPAGLNDRNEGLEEVARRELLEETGCEAGSLELLCRGPLSSGASTELMTVYVGRDVVCGGMQALDRAEEIEVLKLPVEGFHRRVESLCGDDTCLDLKVPGLFEMAIRRGT